VAKLYGFWIMKNYRESYGMYCCNGILFNHESERRGENFVTRKITLAAARIAQGYQDKLYLGNLNSLRDWGYAKDYIECMWLILQQPEPDDFVIATGEYHTVREFATLAFKEVGIELEWRGDGVDEKGYDKKTGKILVEVDPKYFRPAEVDQLLGNPANGMGAGTIGEVCAAALLLGLIYMLVKKIITWHIPVSILCTVFVFSGLMHMINPVYANPVYELLSGGLMLGAIFMATDYVTSPMTKKGQLIYGVAIGFLTIVIRNWGSYPEGMSFAILIMNGFTPLINHYMKPKRYGIAK
jgi:hypothetical protein